MIRQIENFRIGAIDPLPFIVAEKSRRARNLGLSRYRDVENVHSAGINTLDLDAEGRYLLSGCSDGSLYIHDLFNFTGSPNFTACSEHVIQRNHKFSHQFSVECVQWYPQDSGLFVTGSMDKNLKVWDSNRMRPVETVKFEGHIFQLHMSPIASSKCLVAVTGSESKVRLLDLNTGSSTHELRGHDAAVLACRWSPYEEHLLATGGCDGRIILWDARSCDRTLRVLDQNNGQVPYNKKNKLKSHDGAVNGLCFTPNGHNLISLGLDAKAKLWNMTTGLREDTNFGVIPSEIRKCIQFDIAGGTGQELMFIPSDGRILVYEVQTGERIKILQGHYNLVNSCKYNTLHQELYSGANDRCVLIWTADHMQEGAYEDYIYKQSGNAQGPSTQADVITRDVWSSDEDD